MKLYNCVNFLLSRAQQTVVQIYKDELEEFDLTPAQYTVLRCLWELGSLSPGQIAEATYIDRPAVTGILDGLEVKGLITRIPDFYDRRSINICLTEQAVLLKQSILQKGEAAHNEALKGLTDRQKQEFLNMLHIISDVPDL